MGSAGSVKSNEEYVGVWIEMERAEPLHFLWNIFQVQKLKKMLTNSKPADILVEVKRV